MAFWKKKLFDIAVVGITNTSLSLKLQMDGALTVKSYRHGSTKRGGKKENSFLRSNFATGCSSNVDVVQGQGATSLTITERKVKTVNKSQRGRATVAGHRQITRKRWVQDVTAPVSSAKTCDTLNAVCRSEKIVDTVVTNAHCCVAFLCEMEKDDQPWLGKVDLEAVDKNFDGGQVQIRHRHGRDMQQFRKKTR